MKRDWLKEIRIQKGLKQKQVADQGGFSWQLYSHIETGRRVPRIEIAKKIANQLGFEWTRFYENIADQAPTGTEGWDRRLADESDKRAYAGGDENQSIDHLGDSDA